MILHDTALYFGNALFPDKPTNFSIDFDIGVFSVGELGAHFFARSHSS
jgi:hypothetical protein